MVPWHKGDPTSLRLSLRLRASDQSAGGIWGNTEIVTKVKTSEQMLVIVDPVKVVCDQIKQK